MKYRKITTAILFLFILITAYEGKKQVVLLVNSGIQHITVKHPGKKINIETHQTYLPYQSLTASHTTDLPQLVNINFKMN